MLKRFPISYKIAILNFAVFILLCLSIVLIGFLTLHSKEMYKQATDRQSLHIRIAWEVLNKLGTDFRIVGDNLYAGEHLLNADFNAVDKIKNLVGGTATIFMHDIRVATNVMKEDGTRAVGTPLAQGPAYDAIFKKGLPYRGEADILGTSYFTAYDPIKNNAGEVIGILYVGIARDEVFASTKKILFNIIFTVIGFGLFICVLSFFAARQIVMRPLMQSVSFAKDISNGILTGDVTIKRHDELGDLLESLVVMQEKLTEVINGIRTGANEVSSSSIQVARGNADLSQRTQEQASSLEQVASSMEEMTSTVSQNADNAQQAHKLAQAAGDHADQGGAVVSKAVAAMDEITTASNKIANIIGVIDEIAFQTNLLALNAAVEAARAGEQGRGFAVVAAEVRNLAGRSAAAAKEIKGLIRDSVTKVEEGSKLVNESGETLHMIVTSVKKVTDIVAEIAAASREQSSGIAQVNKAVLQMDDMTQQNASLVEQASAASESVGAQAQDLGALVAYFKMKGDADGDGQQPAQLAQKPARHQIATRTHVPADKKAPQKQPPAHIQKAQKQDDSDWQEF